MPMATTVAEGIDLLDCGATIKRLVFDLLSVVR
jgi:hypothetical protein